MSAISKQALLVDNNQSFPNNNAGEITPSDLRAFNVNVIDSTVNQTEYTTNSGSWNVSIGQLNAFTASQQPSFNGLNAFTASQLIINSGVNAATQSAIGRLNNLENTTSSLNAWSSSINQIIVNGASIGTSTRFFFNGFASASIVPNIDGAIANITILSDPSLTPTASFNAYTASINAFTASQNSFNASATASISELLALSSSLSGGYATQGELDQSASVLQANIDTKLNTSSFNSFTSSGIFGLGFATTGSNAFIGVQSINSISGSGTGEVYLLAESGSLVIGNSTTTPTYAAMMHISSSTPNANTNLIFKNSTATADTIVSGSANIFANPVAPTAGFKRYVGGSSNIFTHGFAVPQISGSMAWSPLMNANIFSHANTNVLTFRGPVSSSTAAVSNNIVMGGTINLGTSPANNFEKATSGVIIANNGIFGGQIQMIAKDTTLINAPNVTANLLFGSTLNLNLQSSSVQYQSNIQNGGVTLNNSFLPISGTIVAALSPRITLNTVYGHQHVINMSGSNTATNQSKTYYANILAGMFLSSSMTSNSDNNHILATGLLGNALVVTGSSTSANVITAFSPNDTQGTVIVGRFNDGTGTKASTAETVFAVGTGTSTTRKTGFLIDSGSNSVVDGSLTITGSVYGNVSASAINFSTASIDLSRSNYFTLTMAGTTNINVINARPGVTATLVINTSDGAVASFSNNVKQPSGSLYVASPSGNIDIISFTAVDSNTVYAFPAQSFV
jgi:hypothetical protein